MYCLSVEKMYEEDTYKEGCIGEAHFVEVYKAEFFGSIEKLLEFFETFGKGTVIFDNRLEVQVTENGDGDVPSEREIDLWKKGKNKLYSVTYTGCISKVKPCNAKDLIKLFPNLEITS